VVVVVSPQADTVPDATMGEVGVTLPPVGSMVMASALGRFAPSTLK
jgi:hypothetical protein